MRAFLSHSSKDKPFVEAVAQNLRPGTYELDQTTFAFGLLNHEAILQALDRSDVFAIFVSADSIDSQIVEYEAKIAQELYARGAMTKLLFFCIDKASFNKINASWKSFNFVRNVASPKVAAHQILSALIEARAAKLGTQPHFVGRSRDLEAAKNRVIDADFPAPKAVLVSGNRGIGRRTFLRHFYKETFPGVNTVMPEFPIAKFDGYDELYRKLSDHYLPSRPIRATLQDYQKFASLADDAKVGELVRILGDAQQAREAVIFRDDGGVFQDKGALRAVIATVVEALASHPHPVIDIVAERTPPLSERRANQSIAYFPLNSLDEGSAKQLMALKLRERGVEYNNEQLQNLTELSDGHPFNINYVVESVSEYGVDAFIANPTALVLWKNRRTGEYVESLEFSDEEALVLGVLRQFPSLEFSIIADALDIPESDCAEALAALIDKHIVEVAAATYYISPPLRGAAERSPRFELQTSVIKNVLSSIATRFVAVDESRSVSASFVEAGILAILQSDNEIPSHFSAFLLPSHLIWLARRHYDSRRFADALKLAEQALDGFGRLSVDGKNEACRLMCLAAARLDRKEQFDRGMKALRELPPEDFIQSNREFLLGFRERLEGNLPTAEQHQREAIRIRPGFFAASRELASICLARGNIVDAERFARHAYEIAPDNPFVLDVLASVLISSLAKGNGAVGDEICDLLDKLELQSKDDKTSFYETRRAEYELAKGNIAVAERFIGAAIKKTPNIFDVQALRARIAVARDNATVVSDSLRVMNNLVRRSSKAEGRRNLRGFLDLRIEYSLMVKNFSAARNVYQVRGVFDDREIEQGLKSIDQAEAYSKGGG